MLFYFSENVQLRRKVATLQKTCRRHLDKIIKLQKAQRKTLSKQFQNENATKVLQKSFSRSQANILVQNSKRPKKWSVDDITEGLVLRSFSRKAYNFLREKKKLPLPSETTLRAWIKNFKCWPGIQFDSTNVLKSKLLTEDSSLSTLGVLAFDEMEISKWYEYDQETDAILGPHKKVQVNYNILLVIFI